MIKEEILAEIRRIAAETEGQPPGWAKFRTETGISESAWRPYLWLRWGDALIEAGFEPNRFAEKRDDNLIIKKYVDLARELGKLPIVGEMKLRKLTDKSFPNPSVFLRQFGEREQLISVVAEYCRNNSGNDDILRLCEDRLATSQRKTDETKAKDQSIRGYVYLTKWGKYYKIGRTNSVERREREIGLIVPDSPRTIHWIATDDPSGVEAYWHRRFSEKRGKGEFFSLSKEDVAAFKRWKKIA